MRISNVLKLRSESEPRMILWGTKALQVKYYEILRLIKLNIPIFFEIFHKKTLSIKLFNDYYEKYNTSSLEKRVKFLRNDIALLLAHFKTLQSETSSEWCKKCVQFYQKNVYLAMFYYVVVCTGSFEMKCPLSGTKFHALLRLK